MNISTSERLARRTAAQCPISQYKCRVIYLANGKERKSPWLYSRDRGQAALLMMRKKYGDKNAILYRD